MCCRNIWVCVYMCVYKCTHLNTWVDTCKHTYYHTDIRQTKFEYAHLCVVGMYEYVYTCVYIMSMYTCVCTSVCTYMRMYMFTKHRKRTRKGGGKTSQIWCHADRAGNRDRCRASRCEVHSWNALGVCQNTLESCDTYQRVVSHVPLSHESCHTYQRVMSHATYTNETSHESCHTYQRVMSHGPHTNESWVMSHIPTSHEWETSRHAHEYRYHHTYVYSCLTADIPSLSRKSDVTYTSWHTWAMSRTSNGHVTYQSCHTWVMVMSHIRHVTHEPSRVRVMARQA